MDATLAHGVGLVCALWAWPKFSVNRSTSRVHLIKKNCLPEKVRNHAFFITWNKCGGDRTKDFRWGAAKGYVFSFFHFVCHASIAPQYRYEETTAIFQMIFIGRLNRSSFIEIGHRGWGAHGRRVQSFLCGFHCRGAKLTPKLTLKGI